MKSWMSGLSMFGLATLALVSLSACESSEDRTLSSAQSCLDGATNEAQASQCVEMVKGLQTTDAYLIRCSAAFIANGFTGQKIADAYLTLSDSSSQSSTYDPMVSIMAYLNFSSSNQNFTAAAATSNCEKSGLRSMYQLATAANLSSTLTSIAGVTIDLNNPEASIQTIIDQYSTDITNGTLTVDLTDLGNVALTANTAFCTGVANPNQDICTTLSNAISVGGANNPAAIAEQLIGLLQ